MPLFVVSYIVTRYRSLGHDRSSQVWADPDPTLTLTRSRKCDPALTLTGSDRGRIEVGSHFSLTLSGSESGQVRPVPKPSLMRDVRIGELFGRKAVFFRGC
jgi:hypothetical protein